MLGGQMATKYLRVMTLVNRHKQVNYGSIDSQLRMVLIYAQGLPFQGFYSNIWKDKLFYNCIASRRRTAA
jgi:hypothetical protein